ncbi:DUF3530 family protein [Pseudoalteromonas luteoviolacea]|uniref:DUF3530 domain-containing protein n=1 Tax=Pseudoalteromonas luteoviolacea DSM 6061 TaxID=1365250 RepID=A0A166YGE1_9GAMM|nr:DUF3530 family protein [Pseudoalteromonas luteoviolacea]KZN42605.1 hypothetical protein N475_09755 [Pseudoalteromonas luteoviolacea DSM 6061]KZN59982.1 hypothetical protein N474_06195 [Pseudoalteromonas luteoviolacea CPMOR-2]MBE0385201.1 hypothetical protein [Pseudoalteromonas luteoviolacea DSM 6061]TQF69838.1 DUF3530 family protein [Pseudoalteromonas luteoviolacea]
MKGQPLLLSSLLVYLVLTLVSTQTFAVEHVAPIAKSEVIQSDLDYWFASDSFITIKDDEREIPVLFSEYMSGSKRGIIVMLPGIGQSSVQGNGLSYLREALNDDGYDTYVIPSPSFNHGPDLMKDAIGGTDDEMKDKNRSASVPMISETALNDYKTELVARFSALYKTLALRDNEHIAILAFGNSAGLITEYLATLPNIRVDALITVSAQLANPNRNKHLPASLSLVSPALLDVYYSYDNPAVLHTIKDRRRWAKRNSKYDYRQRQLFGQHTQARQHQRLRKELSGFLRQL